jgi:hypothetical protein
MLHVQKLLLAAAIGTAAVLAVPASAQVRDWQTQGSWGWQDHHHDRDHRDNMNNDAYRNGYQDAQRDREHNARWRPRGNRWKGDYRHAYEDGYRAGFYGGGQYGYGDRDRDGDRGYGGYGYPNGRYGNGRYGRGGAAAQFGYQDGFSYGQRDASRGKGYNATGSEYYENADHGYNSSFGDKNSYRQAYRQAYQQGYQNGYYGRGGRRY